MGNGSGLKKDNDPNSVVGSYGDPVTIDTSGGAFTQDMLEAAAQASVNNFRMLRNPIIFMPPQYFTSAMFEVNPQYSGTPWAIRDRLTKREHQVAAVHTFLKKLKVLKNLSDEDMYAIKKLSIKRLKRAKWAQYGGKKV